MPLLNFIILGLIIGIIVLLTKIKKKPIPKAKIDLKDAQAKIIYEAKYDEENPDNLIIEWKQLLKIGEKGSEMTPIAVFYCIGTEMNQRRILILNLNNPKEKSDLTNPPLNEVVKSINKMADNPPEEEIREEIQSSYDMYGKPIITTRIRRPSSTEKMIEKEKQEAEEKGAI